MKLTTTTLPHQPKFLSDIKKGMEFASQIQIINGSLKVSNL
jgi:hypothetical protein